MNISTEMICYIIALPIVTFIIGIWVGGAEARAELKELRTKEQKIKGVIQRYNASNRIKD